MEKQVEVLIIEDNEDDAELIVRALKIKMPGITYVVMRDGQRALDYIFSDGNLTHPQNIQLPSLILLDLDIPKLRGTEVLKAIRNHDKTRKIPVVILTVSKDSPDLKACYELGANSYIVKPASFVRYSMVISDIGHYWLSLNEEPPVN